MPSASGFASPGARRSREEEQSRARVEGVDVDAAKQPDLPVVLPGVVVVVVGARGEAEVEHAHRKLDGGCCLFGP